MNTQIIKDELDAAAELLRRGGWWPCPRRRSTAWRGTAWTQAVDDL